MSEDGNSQSVDGCDAALRLVLSRQSLLTPELAVEWLAQIGEVFGGRPAWTGASMRRLLSAADDIKAPLIFSLAPEVQVDDQGVFTLEVPQPLSTPLLVTFDPRQDQWETAEAIGWGIDGLSGRVWRWSSGHKDFGPLEGAACLAACLGLALLKVLEQQKISTSSEQP